MGDVKIMLDTVKAVINREGISQNGEATMEDFTDYVRRKSTI